MFTYAIARDVNKGYIDERYSTIAEKGWDGILSKYIPTVRSKEFALER